MSGRLVRVAAAVAVAAVAAVSAPASAATQKSYTTPFRVGPSGGDQFSYHQASSDGTVTVGRIYPVPGVINCAKGGPYAKLLVTHRATRPVTKVVLSYTTAAVDNFTFVMLGLRNGHHWLGTTTLRGLVAGSGTVTLRPAGSQGRLPRPLTIEFGLQQSSACPNADAGTVRFTKVQVFS